MSPVSVSASAYEKLQAIKADFERLRVVLLNVKKREQLKLSLLEYNKELFEQQMFDKLVEKEMHKDDDQATLWPGGGRV